MSLVCVLLCMIATYFLPADQPPRATLKRFVLRHHHHHHHHHHHYHHQSYSSWDSPCCHPSHCSRLLLYPCISIPHKNKLIFINGVWLHRCRRITFEACVDMLDIKSGMQIRGLKRWHIAAVSPGVRQRNRTSLFILTSLLENEIFRHP
jgi:hypothetical protein